MTADEMPIGRSITVAQTDAFRSTATRVSDEWVEIAYYDQPTNDETLRFRVRVDGRSAELLHFDRVYWGLTINGRPATERDLEDLTRKSWKEVSVDGASRKVTVSV